MGPVAADVGIADVALVLSGSLLWLLWYTLELEPMYPWYSAGVS